MAVAISKLFLNFWGYLVINQDKLAGKTPLFEHRAPSLDLMDESQLRELRGRIDALLPQDNLSDMDMAVELVTQLNKVKKLQDDVLDDDETPANQRAQVAGQVASVMQQLIKLQGEFYTPDRFRKIENMMILYMKKLPLADARAFIDEYERLGEEE